MGKKRSAFSRSHPRNGQTVVALVNGEATVKKLYRKGESEIELRPANNRMQPIFAPAPDVEVLGVVTGLIRNYRKKGSF